MYSKWYAKSAAAGAADHRQEAGAGQKFPFARMRQFPARIIRRMQYQEGAYFQKGVGAFFFAKKEDFMTLETWFQAHPNAAAACSGGTDSAFLLWAAKEYGCNVRAYYVKTAFQPRFE